jgi:hypothetical protein
MRQQIDKKTGKSTATVIFVGISAPKIANVNTAFV